MRKFLISVDGNQYEVDVEEITGTDQTTNSTTMATAPKAASVSPSFAGAATPSANEKTQTPKETQQAPKSPANGQTGSLVIYCPMPGTIIKVPVAPGQEVKMNQVLCVLEAMKMQNEIVSPRDGIVANVSVSKGASVNAGDALLSLV